MARQAHSPNIKSKPQMPAIPKDAPKLTKESFEKELQALKAKAQEETWARWAKEQAWVLIQSATLLSLAAIYSNVSQLTLSPIYGSIPAGIWHSKGVMAICFLGWSSNLFLKRRLPVKPVQLLPLIAAFIPMVQFFVFKISGTLGARFGPLIVESVTFFPLLLLSVSSTATILDDLEMSPGRFQWLSDGAPGVVSYAFFKGMEYFWKNKIQSTIGSTLVHTRLGLQIVLTGLYSIFAPSKLLLYAWPALLHTALLNTHVPVPYHTGLLNGTLNASGWSLIDRQESLTGYISVLESKEQHFRVMRCDHSLLGGEWLIHKSTHNRREPIYGVFVMLEAVRLVEVPNPVPDKEASALVIGLGIGTTPAALITHGIETTIVEIDPTVYDFARKYFALPSKHTPIIADAISYASELAKSGQKFDYVVHDVFTGGAEPVDLFTLEFLTDLHSILKPGGVIAINYAGDLLLPSHRIVIRTIRSIFPTCRIYRETAAPADASLDFTNMVIFCTNSPSAITFRKPNEKDWLGSGARQMFLLPQHEVTEDSFGKVLTGEGDDVLLLKNSTDMFGPWQEKSALGHWALMRTVLPDLVWENW